VVDLEDRSSPLGPSGSDGPLGPGDARLAGRRLGLTLALDSLFEAGSGELSARASSRDWGRCNVSTHAGLAVLRVGVVVTSVLSK
jgi:hypothetical protein